MPEDKKPEDKITPLPLKPGKKRPPTSGSFKPGQSGNPAGRAPNRENIHKLSKFSQLWLRATAPDDWIDDSLEFARKKGVTVQELIVMRAMWCLTNNVKYHNSTLLAELMNRTEGKIPLRVLSKEAAIEDDFQDLTEEELQAYLDDLDRRTRRLANDTPKLPHNDENSTGSNDKE